MSLPQWSPPPGLKFSELCLLCDSFSSSSSLNFLLLHHPKGRQKGKGTQGKEKGDRHQEKSDPNKPRKRAKETSRHLRGKNLEKKKKKAKAPEPSVCLPAQVPLSPGRLFCLPPAVLGPPLSAAFKSDPPKPLADTSMGGGWAASATLPPQPGVAATTEMHHHPTPPSPNLTLLMFATEKECVSEAFFFLHKGVRRRHADRHTVPALRQGHTNGESVGGERRKGGSLTVIPLVTRMGSWEPGLHPDLHCWQG